MRVAALYDIHGNLPALEAVLEDVRRAEAELVVVGGDVFPGPMSVESLDRLLDLDLPVRCLRGNGDREVLALAEGREVETVPAAYREAMEWEARQLGPQLRRVLADWPATVRIEIPRLGEVLFCHATPRSDSEIFTRSTPARRLAAIFESTGAALVVCGHTHMQFDRRIGSVRVLNAGSVGMPFGEPGAYWLLLGHEIELRRTRYDLARAAERVRATAYPGAEEFAVHNVLEPRSEREMLALFSRAEIDG